MSLPTDGLLAAFDMTSSQNTAQQIYDLSGNGNHMMVGSTTGADTNDFTLTGTGALIGTDDMGKLSQDVFDDLAQFTVIASFNVAGYGPINQGRIWDKSTRFLRFNSGALTYQQNRTGANSWSTASIVSLNTTYVVGLSYDGQIPDTSPIFHLDSNIITSTKAGTGTGACASDASVNLALFNTNSAARNLDGTVYKMLWYNKILSDIEYASGYDWVLNGDTPSGTIAEAIATSYANKIYAIPFRAASGIRTESGIILPAWSDAYRIGQGSRSDVTVVKKTVSNVNRAGDGVRNDSSMAIKVVSATSRIGKGIRTENSTTKPVIAVASRFAQAIQTVTSWARRIVGKAVAMVLLRNQYLNCKVTVITRTTKLDTITRTTKAEAKTRKTKVEVIQ